jgi:large subunit ribosomal protein L32
MDVVSGERHIRHNMTADGFYRGKRVLEIKVAEETEETT